ncbi:endolytic transglycosylase MltG [Undibacterium oligocarboniphilum]|uniref:Endolytic murein transglycosylase n=1 Tax=Undibacterium oligocarboniphilum TaxID=666702 RepID=A0A850QCR0_9BURK|nr:endolytic transglycosylase MltG [Undibacterium oligocarboniphilum]MBC3868647.1 endolytic transglycosylase MltG [Undibacterium oligocarboniphilum]NVO76627.1 endolytic transglycosylase MltG [Undibacterium oligocarboniphilum]
MRLIRLLFILLVFAAVAASAGFQFWTGQVIEVGETPVEFTIRPGSSVRSATRQMHDAGLPVQPLLMELLARLSGKANQIKAGSYALEQGKTPLQLLDKIVNGEFSMGSVVIIEGWNFSQMRKAIDAQPALKHDSQNLSNAALMKKIGSDYSNPEGLFFPDTYLFPKGSSDLLIYQQAHAVQLKRLQDSWSGRAEHLPYKNPYEALIMASIIEKETGQKSERPLIAAVFVNRLKAGMLLQTDPTVIYGMGEQYQGKIHKRDLQTDTPYNTYTRAGLPPTPIALPGQASLSAALNPAQSDALYFVAKGDGTSHFSDNLDAHNRAVNQFQR